MNTRTVNHRRSKGQQVSFNRDTGKVEVLPQERDEQPNSDHTEFVNLHK